MHRQARYFFLIVALITVLSGCGLTIVDLREISINPQVKARVENKLPVKVGIFIPEEFRTYRYVINHSVLTAKWTGSVDMGRNLTIAFYNIISSTFENTVFMKDHPHYQLPTDADIQLIAIPEVKDLKVNLHRPTPFHKFKAELNLACEFYDVKGNLIYRIIAVGKSSLGGIPSDLHFAVSTIFKEAVEDALNNLTRQIKDARELKEFAIGQRK